MPDTTRQRDVTSGFAELVYADPAWLDAEFDAIMAANFDRPVPPAPVDRGRPSRPRRVPAPAAHRWPTVPIPAPEPPRRERGPPPRPTSPLFPDEEGR